MSFTLMHYKNGIPRPIKMSIWDAFKGAPIPKRPKPQPVSLEDSRQPPEPSHISEPAPLESKDDTALECSCCHKIHVNGKEDAGDKKAEDESKSKSKQEKGEEKKAKDGNEKESKEKGGDNQFSTKDQESYSEEDDQTIIKMKSEGKSWKEILSAINKTSTSQLKEHWKKINPASQDEAGKKDTAENAKGKADATEKKSEEKAEKKGKQEQNGKKSSDGVKPDKKNNPKETAEQTELQNWSDRYDKQKWIAAASRHFDLTGQRITPATAKKLAAGK